MSTIHQDQEAPQAFGFSGLPVHVLSIDGNPRFAAKDACDVLGLTNPTEALRGLDDDKKITLRVSEAIRPLDADERGLRKVDTLGGPK